MDGITPKHDTNGFRTTTTKIVDTNKKKSKLKKNWFQSKMKPKIWDMDSWTGTKKGERMCHTFSRIGHKF